MKNNKILFFYNTKNSRTLSFNKEVKLKSWSPKKLNIKPIFLPYFPFTLWFIFHHLKVFKNNNYKIYYLELNNKIVHKTVVFPKFFRFNFMKKNDLQLGDIFTSKDLRGKGIASKVLNNIIYSNSSHDFWFLCDENNLSSVKIAYNNKFKLIAYGYKITPLRLNIFSYYKISKYY